MKRKTLRLVVAAASAAVLSAVVAPPASADAAWYKGTAHKRVRTTVDGATAASFERLADAVLSDRTAALLDRGPSSRTALRQDRGIRVAAALARAEGGGLADLKARKARLAVLGEAYSGADTRVAVDRVRVLGERALVQVTETTTLTYKKIRGDEPGTTGFQAHHELNFKRGSAGGWELTGIRPTDSGPLAINQPAPVAARVATTDALPKATPAATSWPAASAPKNLDSGTYDYRAMAAYAEKYWQNYNPAYRKFNDMGGDCTNFVSQSLKAGGWQHAPGSYNDYRTWWYGDSYQSTSWVGADEWSWFTLSQKRATNLANVYQMDVGDIMQMDFDRNGSKDHTMVVSYRGWTGVPYLTYHSVNTYRKSVASIIASYPNAAYYAYRT
ncbi:amidase domain-containing protein [Streptomyces sp. TRM64462]|uniref:amidase domain-containing protein n=1 Tax=Streptomyces sp. TRM64462 TaxID=2741726 RepID=UPI0015866595|nr:amidase domain-containing protein [Streptomyces sp. TRM64462]